MPSLTCRPACWLLGAAAFCSVAFSPQTIRVTIDVKPGDSPTTVESDRGGLLPVAILSTAQFDAVTIDPATIRIGPTGTEAAAVRTTRDDVDADGRADLMALVRVQELKLKCTDTVIRLSAQTGDGAPIEGSEAITVTGCA